MKSVRVPASKSDAHRALLCGALAAEPCNISISDTSDDIEATRRCAAVIEARVREMRKTSARNRAKRPEEAELDVGESGTTLRLVLPLAAALGQPARFIMHGRLPERPLSPLKELLLDHGVNISTPQMIKGGGTDGAGQMRVSGQLTWGDFPLPGNVSSQFVSGLLLSLPMLPHSSRITVTSRLESAPYVEMTLRVMKAFGVFVAAHTGENFSIYDIYGGQTYRACDYTAEGDWSAAANWIAAGVIGDEPIRICGLSSESVQGDRSIIRILHDMGADVLSSINGDVIANPSRGKLHGIRIDASQVPDIVPVLALVATQAEGTTEIYNAGRLRLKESDRLSTTTAALTTLGFDVKEQESGLVINGTGKQGSPASKSEDRDPVSVATKNDHRIAMMAAAASLVTDRKVRIIGKDCAAKSYPAFFDEFARLGFGGNLIN